jgi:hypothetical protein
VGYVTPLRRLVLNRSQKLRLIIYIIILAIVTYVLFILNPLYALVEFLFMTVSPLFEKIRTLILGKKEGSDAKKLAEHESEKVDSPEKLGLKQIEQGLIRPLRFFLSNWKVYEKLILDLSFEDFRKEEIRDCFNEINFAISKARNINLESVNTIILEVKAISRDMEKLYSDLLPLNEFYDLKLDGKEVKPSKQTLITRGNAICKEVKGVIPEIECSFATAYKLLG